jgi:hypothetical protein
VKLTGPPVVLGGEGLRARANTEHELTLEAAKKRDPGPGPWCPVCGAPAQALAVPRGPGFPNNQKLGVCQGCGSVCKPDHSVTGETLPFLFHVSDLRPGIPGPVLEVQRQVREAIRRMS